ncbi:hypothetical protein ACQ4PT_002459 [Festuca glaucescens]
MDEFAGNGVAPPPLLILPDDLPLEILLRLPPEPIYLFRLFRASIVSKHWHGLVHDVGFLRRFREFHGGTPPVLGFFNNQPGPPLFVPTTCSAAASAAAKMSHKEVWALDCRHGLALLQNRHSSALFVWDLVTGDQRYLPMPPATTGVGLWNGALLHAAGHGGDCPSSPFLVVYVCSLYSNGYCTCACCVYSSETGIWTETASIATLFLTGDVKRTPLVGNTLYWILGNSCIFEFDLDSHRLGLIERIPDDMLSSYGSEVVIMPTEDGLLGFAGVQGFHLHL